MVNFNQLKRDLVLSSLEVDVTDNVLAKTIIDNYSGLVEYRDNTYLNYEFLSFFGKSEDELYFCYNIYNKNLIINYNRVNAKLIKSIGIFDSYSIIQFYLESMYKIKFEDVNTNGRIFSEVEKILTLNPS